MTYHCMVASLHDSCCVAGVQSTDRQSTCLEVTVYGTIASVNASTLLFLTLDALLRMAHQYLLHISLRP